MLLAGCVWSASALASDVQVQALLDQANALRTAEPREVDSLLDTVEGMLDRASDRQREALRILRAHRMITSGRSDEAVTELLDVLRTTADASSRFEALSMLASVYAVQRRFEDSMRMIETLLPLVGGMSDPELRHRGLMVASLVYNQVGEFVLARQYAGQVLEDRPSGRNACAAGGATLEAINGLGQRFEDAEGLSGLRRCEAAQEPIFSGFLRLHIARQWQTQGRQDEARELLSSGLEAVEKTRYPFLIAQTRAILAQLCHEADLTEDARIHAQAAFVHSGGAGSGEARVIALDVRYKLALEQGDPAETLVAYRAYAEAERAHFNDVKSREMAYQVVRHQSLQQAQQIELLHQKNELLELQKRVTEQRAQSWLLLALVLVGGMASVGYWAYKTKRLQMRLKRMTEVDALTGICNRQHFADRAGAALAGCELEGRPGVLVMFDLDHFKQVNDRFGHAAGDWALQQVAAVVRPLCRNVDSFGRLGGEEFALFLPGMDEAGAARLAGDIQDGFGAVDTIAAGYDFRLAASFGIASVASAGYNLTALMRQADQAMYAAKRGGRRQSRRFEPAMDATGWLPAAPELVRNLVLEIPSPEPAVDVPGRRAIA